MATKKKSMTKVTTTDRRKPVAAKQTMGQKVKARLREPSTWSALAALAALFGVPLMGADIAMVSGGLAAIAGIIIPEGAQ